MVNIQGGQKVRVFATGYVDVWVDSTGILCVQPAAAALAGANWRTVLAEKEADAFKNAQASGFPYHLWNTAIAQESV